MLNLYSMETNADIKLITHREASKSGCVSLTEESHALRLKNQQLPNCCRNIFKWQDFYMSIFHLQINKSYLLEILPST